MDTSLDMFDSSSSSSSTEYHAKEHIFITVLSFLLQYGQQCWRAGAGAGKRNLQKRLPGARPV